MSYPDSSHGSAHPFQKPGDALNRYETYTISPGHAQSAMRIAPTAAQFGRADAGPEVGSPCNGAASHRLSRVRASRRAWIERKGEVPATTPVWLSRDAWLADVRAWAESTEFAAVCASVQVSIASATVVAVAVAWARPADYATGRHAAITRERIAQTVGCAAKTVSRAWKVLGAAGWAVEVARGHGASEGHTAGRRPSIWHLISRRPTVQAAAESGDNVHLPPKVVLSSITPVGSPSPSVRERAHQVSCSNQPHRRRRWRATPRPLAVQILAAQLVARSHGLGRGHIGAICDALAGAGITPEAWTARQISAALDADMRTRGWSWPDRIENPGAFLAARLRRLPARPGEVPCNGGGAAGLDKKAVRAATPVPPVHVPRPQVALSSAQQARIAAAQAEIRRTLADRQHARCGKGSAPGSGDREGCAL